MTNIHTIDLNFQNQPHAIACYLIEGPTGLILIETGPSTTLPLLLDQIRTLGYQPTDVAALLVTHIHFDHAGAAGWWTQQGTQLYVHPVGAPHLIDPAKLVRSATRIYQDKMATLWGEITPALPEKVTTISDGDLILAGGLQFTALDTPGHAYHHHCYQLEKIAFTGDVAGIRLPDSSWVDLPAPPPEFHLETWHKSIQKLRDANLDALYPTHFGRTDDVDGQLTQLETLLDTAVAFVQSRLDAGQDRDLIVAAYLAWIAERAQQLGISDRVAARYEAANPHFMSVDGIIRYCRKQRLAG